MVTDPSESRYFLDPQTIAQSLTLAHLGTLAAQLRVHELTGSLAGLAPEPRFAERLLRFVTGELPLVWVAGLGTAGEEIPIAVGLAGRAAASGTAPVLLVRAGETRLAGAAEVTGRPIEAGVHFGTVLEPLFPAGLVASATGIQGVYRAWSEARAEGEALWPAAVVVAAAFGADAPEVPAGVTHLILVIPYRDQPRETIEAAVGRLRAVGRRILGFVAIESPASPFPMPPAQPAGAHAIASAPPREPGEREEVVVARAWTDAFGPRRGRRRRKGPQGSRPSRTWLYVLAGGALVVLAAIAGGLLLPRLMRAPAPASRQAERPADSATAASPSRAPAPEGASMAPADSFGKPAFEFPAASRVDALEPEWERDGLGDSMLDESAAFETDSLGDGLEPEFEVAPGAIPVAEAPDIPAPRGAEARLTPLDAPKAAPPGTEVAGESVPPAAEASAAQAAPPAGSATEQAHEPAYHDMVPQRDAPFAILCGSFQSEQRAVEEVKRLVARSRDVRRVAVRIPDRGIWHRVLVGHCTSEAEARELARTLLDAGDTPACQIVCADGKGIVIGSPITRGGGS
jgi:hypothetical protein